MNLSDIARLRMHVQGVISRPFQNPADVVNHLLAVQAQDYLGSLWALGARTNNAIEKTIEQAIDDRKIVRTWPMRGTLHYVPAQDVRWMLTLMTPRIIARSMYRFKQLEITDAELSKSHDLFIEALSGGKILTRTGMYEVLESHNIATKNYRGLHIIGYHAQKGLLCLAPRQGKQPAFTLLAEWIPRSRILSREESLGEIVLRYFLGHGPATLQDFAWWTALTLTEAKEGLEMVKSKLHQEMYNGQTYYMSPNIKAAPVDPEMMYMLPGYDEIFLGYKDRIAVLANEDLTKVVPGNNGIFYPVIMKNNRIIGIWKRVIKKNTVIINPMPFEPFTKKEGEIFIKEIQRYGIFLQSEILIAE